MRRKESAVLLPLASYTPKSVAGRVVSEENGDVLRGVIIAVVLLVAAAMYAVRVQVSAGDPAPPSVVSVHAAEKITLDPICRQIPAPGPKLPPGKPAPSTRRMAERLQSLYASTKPGGASAYDNAQLAAIYEERAARARNLNEKSGLQSNAALQQLRAGRPDEALNTYASMERLIRENIGYFDPRTLSELRMRQGVAYLRLGEQENCLASHTGVSCLFPLEAAAYHRLPRGSRAAIQLFRERLAERPEDLGARWLLNLAHMTLGEYPTQVDPRYLIGPERFASEFEMPRFVDVSDGLGLDANDLAGGVIVDDFNNDGLYDIVLSAWDPQGQLRFFVNTGEGSFIERTSEAGLVGEVGALNISQTDFNNDGLLDIWMMRGGWLEKAGRLPCSLLRNNGDGTFTDVTEEAGLLSCHPTMATRWFDYDGDGWLDLFVGMESSDKKDPDWCELYHNNHDGTFTECAEISGIRIAAYVKGVGCADYDNDGRPDLFLSVREGSNILLHNDGPVGEGTRRHWHFSDVTAQAGLGGGPSMPFGTFFFDYDNDGWQDILIFGFHLPAAVADVAADYLGMPSNGEKTRLFRNNGDGTFTDVTKEAHLDRVLHTMGHNFGDLDNDGWLDFYCGTGEPDFATLIPNRMFRNAGGKFFQDVTTETGTGHLQKGHAVAFADLDDDGSQDIYASIGGAYSGDLARNVLFLNPGSTNAWVKLKLIGTTSNRAAIGAQIRVTLATPSGSRELYRVVGSGGSFGANPLRQEIGLGDALAILNVSIRWPGSAVKQTVHALERNGSYEIREGVPEAVRLPLHRVRLDRH